MEFPMPRAFSIVFWQEVREPKMVLPSPGCEPMDILSVHR